MERRQGAKQGGNVYVGLAKSLNNEMRKAVQQDKLDHLKAELQEVKDQKYLWTGLKKLRACPNSRFASKERPQQAAQYLAEQQWTCQREFLPPRKVNPTSLTRPNHVVHDNPFTTEELDGAIAKQRDDKTPGPDRLHSELLKYLEANTRDTVLKQIHHVQHNCGKTRD